MSNVFLKDKYLQVKGEQIPLLSGEFHFWRNNKKWWPKIFKEIKRTGLRLITSYVCWDFHEIYPGKYDFTGETNDQCDLDGFLHYCKEAELYLILRPGPYIYSEYLNGGIPPHAADYHRLHPEFMAKARPYLDAVLSVIKPQLVTNGGPIVMVQVDNEIDLMVGPDEATRDISFSSGIYERALFAEGRASVSWTFRYWLKRKYGRIECLNAAWNSAYLDFDNVDCSRDWPATPGEKQRLFDANEYYEEYSTEYLRQITNIYEEAGIDVPLTHNAFSEPQPMNLPEMNKIVDLVGVDIYLPNKFDHDQLNALSLSIRRCKAQTPMAYIAEFMSGIVGLWTNYLGFGLISPEHHRYLSLAAMMFGAQGWNWYMLVEREEWYFSPINERGEAREQYCKHFRDIVRIWSELDWPRFEKVSHCALFWYRQHHFLSKPFAWRLDLDLSMDAPIEVPAKRGTCFEQTADALLNSDIDYEIFDPASMYNNFSAQNGLLFYGGFDYLDSEAEAKLLKLAESGAAIVFLGSYPIHDLTGKPLGLAKLLPRLTTSLTWSGPLKLSYQNSCYHLHTHTLRFYDITMLDNVAPIFAAGQVCGCTRTLGKGKLILLGLDPSPETVAFAKTIANVREACQMLTKGVLSSVWQNEDDVAVLLLNTTEERQKAIAQLDLDLLGINENEVVQVTELLHKKRKKTAGKELKRLTALIEPRDGSVFLIKRISQ